jgi:demethylmenaquinone methyltransferase / 2-methoxy-6-polyprenyl-1,4-benzoquinol methylase
MSRLPRPQEKAGAVRSMFDAIAPRYDLVNRIMTFGLDRSWRKAAVDALGQPRGSLALDVACGTGGFCRELTAAGYRAVGVDFSWGMLASARSGVPLLQADALRLPLRSTAIAAITCGFALRNVTDISALLAELSRVMEQGGRVALLEVARPESPLLRAGHSLYFNRVVPLVGAALSDRAAYRYLPESAAYLPEPAELTRLLEQARFGRIRRRLFGLGAAQLITATRL